MSARRDQIREKVLARVQVDPVTGCWNWTGPTSGERGRGKGYPRMSLSGQTVAVHLVMWTNEHGFIPGKKQLDHKCRNRRCVNPHPDHTELVTHRENMRRRDRFACREVSTSVTKGAPSPDEQVAKGGECVCGRAVCSYDPDFGCGIDRDGARRDA